MENFSFTLLIGAIILLVLALIWAAFRYVQFYKTEHFTCPKCGHNWKPPVLKMIFSANAVEGKIIRCPNCGEKEYMEPIKDKNNAK